MIKKYSKSQIVKIIKIIKICEDESIGLESAISGNFTHRCKCPSPSHKNGNEKTKSLYIDSINNNFYCFGCGANNNSIDFYMMLKGISFADAISQLSLKISDTDIQPEQITSYEVKRSIFPITIEISSIFRGLYKNPEYSDKKWLLDLSRKIDEKIESLDQNDVEGANKVLNSVKKYLKKIGVVS